MPSSGSVEGAFHDRSLRDRPSGYARLRFPRLVQLESRKCRAGGTHPDHQFAGRIPEGWAAGVELGDILVAGSNFGCGSSREIAPIAIRGAGVSLVIADSYARIFFRNAINLGYPILQSPQAAEAVVEGDELEVDLEQGIIRDFTRSDEYRTEAFPPFMNELLRMGGLVPWVRRRLKERRINASRA